MSKDCSDLFSDLNHYQQFSERVIIEAPEYTYLPDGETEEGWLPNVKQAFLALKAQGRKPHTAAIVGCGPGVDALLMLKILKPKILFLTDLDERIVKIAKSNVLNNHQLESGQVLEVTQGDLCEGLRKSGLQFDLIYENLPNLPAPKPIDVAEGALSASFFDAQKHKGIPKDISSNLLSLHYQFLLEARTLLRPGADTLSCIGARVPVLDILKIFESLDYVPEVLVNNLVRQFEAERVLAEYASLEETQNKEFRFFDLDRTIPIFRLLSAQGLGIVELVDRLASEAPAISAEEAAWRRALDGHVGHLGLIIRGELKNRAAAE